MKNIPVFYDPRQTAKNCGSFSPSAGKPVAVLKEWQRHKLPIEVRSFKPATIDQLGAVLGHEFVQDVLTGSRANGFGNTSPDVGLSLPYTVGSMVAASLHVLKNGGVAVSPTSGFHHAGYESASAFCTFNGLMVAAMAALKAGAKKIGILDLDEHYGNGTDNLIRHHKLETKIVHHTAGAMDWPKDNSKVHGNPYFAWLKLAMKDMRAEGVTLIIAQLGADACIDDPLGGNLTEFQLAYRDKMVFDFCAENNIPLAWNLAGGYQTDEAGTIQPVLDIHTRSMDACVQVFVPDYVFEVATPSALKSSKMEIELERAKRRQPSTRSKVHRDRSARS